MVAQSAARLAQQTEQRLSLLLDELPSDSFNLRPSVEMSDSKDEECVGRANPLTDTMSIICDDMKLDAAVTAAMDIDHSAICEAAASVIATFEQPLVPLSSPAPLQQQGHSNMSGLPMENLAAIMCGTKPDIAHLDNARDARLSSSAMKVSAQRHDTHHRIGMNAKAGQVVENQQQQKKKSKDRKQGTFCSSTNTLVRGAAIITVSEEEEQSSSVFNSSMVPMACIIAVVRLQARVRGVQTRQRLLLELKQELEHWHDEEQQMARWQPIVSSSAVTSHKLESAPDHQRESHLSGDRSSILDLCDYKAYTEAAIDALTAQASMCVDLDDPTQVGHCIADAEALARVRRLHSLFLVFGVVCLDREGLSECLFCIRNRRSTRHVKNN